MNNHSATGFFTLSTVAFWILLHASARFHRCGIHWKWLLLFAFTAFPAVVFLSHQFDTGNIFLGGVSLVLAGSWLFPRLPTLGNEMAVSATRAASVVTVALLFTGVLFLVAAFVMAFTGHARLFH